MSKNVKELFLVGLGLALALSLFFRKALSNDTVLSAADGIFSTPFYSQVAPPDFIKPSNPLLFDQVYQFVPWRYFAWRSMRDGQLPLWNPYSYAGTPFIATMQSAVFYPINLFLYLISPFHITLVVSAILRLWISGFCTYLLARHYGLSRVSALVSSLSFMFCGYLIVWLGHPHTNVAVWLPALVLLSEFSLNRPALLSRTLPLLALVSGIQFLGGHIETSVDVLFIFVLYHLIRWLQMARSNWSCFRVWLKGLILPLASVISGGIALASVQLLPFLEWLPNSAEFEHRLVSFEHFLVVNPEILKHLLSLLLLLFPNLYNNPTWDFPYWSFLFNWSNYNEMAVYVGIITLSLAIVAIARGSPQQRNLTWSWTIIALICLGRAFRLPVFDWLNQMPIVAMSNPGRLRLGLSLSLCVLAGFGVQALFFSQIEISAAARRLWLRLTGITVVIGALILIASNAVIPMVKDEIATYGRKMVEVEYRKREAHSNPLEYYYEQVDQMVDGLVWAFSPRNIAMYLPAVWSLLGFVLIAYAVPRTSMIRPASLVLTGIVLADVFTFGEHYNPTIPSKYFYPPTSVTEKIKSDNSLFRVLALRQDLLPDSQMMYGISEIRGLDFPTRWYDRYLKLISARIPWLSYGSIFSSPNTPLLSVLNLKYVIAKNPQTISPQEDFKYVVRIGGVFLGERAKVQPRAYMVYKATKVSSDEEALDILKRDPQGIFTRVILFDPDQSTSAHSYDQNLSTTENEVMLISYEPNRSIWRVLTGEAGYLVITDTFYPGWNAYIDGELTNLYRANVAFRAVFVPSGEHTITLRFEPISVWVGLCVSGVSLAAIVIILSCPFIRRK